MTNCIVAVEVPQQQPAETDRRSNRSLTRHRCFALRAVSPVHKEDQFGPALGADRDPDNGAAMKGNAMDVSKYISGLFLKVEDIKESGPIRVKITDVSEGQYGKLDLTLDDGTRLSCNATNVRALAKAYGFDSGDWVDKEVELVFGEIPYKGKPQEAILVKPISPPIENKAPPKPAPAPPADGDEIPF
jgi:hypothetical protein